MCKVHLSTETGNLWPLNGPHIQASPHAKAELVGYALLWNLLTLIVPTRWHTSLNAPPCYQAPRVSLRKKIKNEREREGEGGVQPRDTRRYLDAILLTKCYHRTNSSRVEQFLEGGGGQMAHLAPLKVTLTAYIHTYIHTYIHLQRKLVERNPKVHWNLFLAVWRQYVHMYVHCTPWTLYTFPIHEKVIHTLCIQNYCLKINCSLQENLLLGKSHWFFCSPHRQSSSS